MGLNVDYCVRCGQPMIDKKTDAGTRRRCSQPTCGWVFWNNPTPVVAAVVERNGHVVLVRSVGWPENWYGLVTGFLEAKEDPSEAVCREVEEELGLSVASPKLIGVYPFRRMNQVIIAYHVTANDGVIELDMQELAGFKEVPLEKARPWRAGTGYALRDFLVTRGHTPNFIGE
ncbi:MAG: NUDIX domain-containing protein [Myxococcota bacterium]|nr:NUDIX domain-containing protein [Myxococcota bacterium]